MHALSAIAQVALTCVAALCTRILQGMPQQDLVTLKRSDASVFSDTNECDSIVPSIIGSSSSGEELMCLGFPYAPSPQVRLYHSESSEVIKTLCEKDEACEFGWAIVGIADINADGVSEFAVSAPGALGQKGSVSIYNGRTFEKLRSLEGKQSGDGYGTAMSFAPHSEDANRGWLLVGAPCIGTDRPGYCELISWPGGNVDSTMHGIRDEAFGFSIAVGQADVSGGFVIAIGAPRAENKQDYPTADHGKAYLCNSKRPENMTQFEGDSGFGWSVAICRIQDGKGDQSDYVVVGQMNQEPSRSVLTVISEKTMSKIGTVQCPECNDACFNSRFGSAIVVIGDCNGDGCEDIAAGAPKLDGIGRKGENTFEVLDAGAVWLISPVDCKMLSGLRGKRPFEQTGWCLAADPRKCSPAKIVVCSRDTVNWVSVMTGR